MRILLISNDSVLQAIVRKFDLNSDTSLLLYDKNPNRLEEASYCFSNKPSVLMVDDDFFEVVVVGC